MYLIGDIGNTEVKICLFNSKKKLKKKITFIKTNLITTDYLKKTNFLNGKKKFFKKLYFVALFLNVIKKLKILLNIDLKLNL